MKKFVAAATVAGVAAVGSAAPAAAVDLSNPESSGQVSAASTPLKVPSPTRGSCWQMTPAQAQGVAFSGTQADCASAHTAEIAGVVTIPAAYTRYGWNSPIVNAWVTSTCRVILNKYTGVAELNGMARFSNFAGFAEARGGYYLPGTVQWRNGTRWAACAALSGRTVIANRAQFSTLTPRTGSVRGAWDRLNLLEVRPGVMGWNSSYASAPWFRVNLSRSPAERLPSPAELRARAVGVCRGLMTDYLWDATWNNSQRSWDAGARFVTCWARYRP